MRRVLDEEIGKLASRWEFEHGFGRSLPLLGSGNKMGLSLPFGCGMRGLWHRFPSPILLKLAKLVAARKQSLCLQPSEHRPGIAGEALFMDFPIELLRILTSLRTAFSQVGCVRPNELACAGRG